MMSLLVPVQLIISLMMTLLMKGMLANQGNEYALKGLYPALVGLYPALGGFYYHSEGCTLH